ncbi:MAG: glycosyltransferase family 4 protein [Nitrospirae bacterium]|nr:glycosyltransferase family 4 protein [Nitrospirota bacterium]
MITVLHTESAKRWGGQERRTFTEAVEFNKKRGYRVILAVQPGSALGKHAEEAGIEVREIRMRNKDFLAALFKIFSLIRKEKVDIVNSHSSSDSWITSFAARLAGRPILLRTRHVTIPISQHPLNIVYKLPRMIITVSNYVRETMIRENRINPEKIVSIPTSVDLEKFDFRIDGEKIREELGIVPGTPLVGIVGVIRGEKGHQYFIEAAQKILKVKPEVRFVIVGLEPRGETVIQKVRELNLEKKILVIGFRPDIPRILAAIDVLAMPSLREALGTALLEALAMKKAVVATSVGGIPEVIIHNQTGLLVPPADSESLAQNILLLLKDREKAGILGENGRHLIEKKFGLEMMLNKIEALYKDLLA